MKPPPFRYHAPETTDQALADLDQAGDDGKVLAGGQSLIPLLNMRLAAPAHLIDINRIAALDRIEVSAGAVTVGAGVRHARLERDQRVAALNPLLRQALHHLAHPVIRNRGTTVGSIVHADPAGELPAVLALLDGSVTLRRRSGSRQVAAADFFVAPLTADLQPGELATAVTFPHPGAGAGTSFEELARRHGDYAMAGVAAIVWLAPDRRIRRARAALTGVGPVPVVVDLTDTCRGQAADATDFAAAVDLTRQRIEPDTDIHATAAYRRHLAGVLTGRALEAATGRAADRETTTS
jgi:carbon-monoxide dehydrogenase medium subunit